MDINIVLVCFNIPQLDAFIVPALYLDEVDQEDDEGYLIPGAWRQNRQLLSGEQIRGPLLTREA